MSPISMLAGSGASGSIQRPETVWIEPSGLRAGALSGRVLTDRFWQRRRVPSPRVLVPRRASGCSGGLARGDGWKNAPPPRGGLALRRLSQAREGPPADLGAQLEEVDDPGQLGRGELR